MMAKQRTYSQYAKEAAILMGEQIKLGRKQRQWTEQNLISSTRKIKSRCSHNG